MSPNCKVFPETEEREVKAIPEWLYPYPCRDGGTLRRTGKLLSIRKEGLARMWCLMAFIPGLGRQRPEEF